MKHLELFAGIGGFRRALDLLGKDLNIQMQCIGFSEIDEKAAKTYSLIFEPKENEKVIGDIVSFTAKKENIKGLEDFDLLTGGFPCQTFSMMGKQEGFNEDRGLMFFRIMDILKIKKPRYVLLENVKNLYTHDKGKTFKRIVDELHLEKYKVASSVFNTADFHLPQTRNRVLIFATTDNIKEEQLQELFNASRVKTFFDRFVKKTSLYHYNSVLDILSKETDEKYFLSEKIKPTILSNGSGHFISKSEINQSIARPLTATMHKMHRACQDNYYSKNYIKTGVNDAENLSKEEQAQLEIRRLTPEEAFALQGFSPLFASKSRKSGVSDGCLYRQAGNAVSVNTIYAALSYLINKNIIKIC